MLRGLSLLHVLLRLTLGLLFSLELPVQEVKIAYLIPEEVGNSQWWVGDLRDIQVANNDMSVTVRWQN